MLGIHRVHALGTIDRHQGDAVMQVEIDTHPRHSSLRLPPSFDVRAFVVPIR
jgi:hypothetical protein